MTTAPVAPWALLGDAMVCLARWRDRSTLPELPPGIRRMPGPCLVMAARYYDSPVGPFLTFVIADPARVRGHLGWHASLAATDSIGAQVGLRLNWGVPADIADLTWIDRDQHMELRWGKRSLSMAADTRRVAMPMVIPARGLQRRTDGPVLVPGMARGLARLATTSVHTYPGDELAPIAGQHVGIVVKGLRYVVKPAQGPAGLFSTLAVSQSAPGGALGFADVSHGASDFGSDHNGRRESVPHRGD